MIKKIMSAIGFTNDTGSGDSGHSRRIYERRSCDACVTQVEDKTYPVENWSQGGVLLSGDSRFFGLHQTYALKLRFRLHDRILDIQHPARVIRKSGEKTALQFMPLPTETRSAFQLVIDDWVCCQFANSQS